MRKDVEMEQAQSMMPNELVIHPSVAVARALLDEDTDLEDKDLLGNRPWQNSALPSQKLLKRLTRSKIARMRKRPNYSSGSVQINH